jgi:hypothetical protein
MYSVFIELCALSYCQYSVFSPLWPVFRIPGTAQTALYSSSRKKFQSGQTVESWGLHSLPAGVGAHSVTCAVQCSAVRCSAVQCSAGGGGILSNVSWSLTWKWSHSLFHVNPCQSISASNHFKISRLCPGTVSGGVGELPDFQQSSERTLHMGHFTPLHLYPTASGRRDSSFTSARINHRPFLKG